MRDPDTKFFAGVGCIALFAWLAWLALIVTGIVLLWKNFG